MTHALIRTLDRAARVFGRDKFADASRAPHLRTGERGEEAAYFHLRTLGYTMVARNWRSPRRRGEIDLIGWHDDVLCFIEVKTRTQRGLVPAEAAVDAEKQRDLRAVAKEYLLRAKPDAASRFDVVSVYFEEGKAAEISVIRDAFAMR